MKFFDFRKYFFSYLYILFCLIFYYFYWTYQQANYPPAKENEFFSDGFGHFAIYMTALLINLWCAGLLVVEMLIRKFVIEKYFPNLKFPLKISLPQKLNLFLSVIFYVLFLLAALPLIF